MIHHHLAPHDPASEQTQRARSGIQEFVRGVLGASGVATTAALAAAGLAPVLLPGNDPSAWLIAMGGNALAGWAASWATTAARQLRTEDLAPAMQADPALAADVLTLLVRLDAHTLLLESLQGQAARQQAQIQTLLEDVQRATFRNERLHAATDQAIQQLTPPPPPAGVTFTNKGVRVGRRLIQSDGSVGVNADPPPVAGSPRPVRFENTDVEVQQDVIQSAESIRLDEPAAPEWLTILAAFTRAHGTPPLAWAQEWRTLWECFSPYPAQFRLEAIPYATVDDLHAALLRLRPAVLHLSGHGDPTGILFGDAQGDRMHVRGTALIQLVTHAPGLRCVVLSACHTAAFATPRADGPRLIVMRGAISDDGARLFAAGFSAALAAQPHGEIAAAYQAGLDRMALYQADAADQPLLV